MFRRIAAVWLSWVIVFSCLVIIVEIAEPVRGATTIYVDDDGGADYTNIQEAIDNSTKGDTVFVYNGYYWANVLINKTITLIGENKDTTRINANNRGNGIHIVSDGVNVSGFNLTLGDDAGIKINNAENCHIFNNTLYNNRYIGIYLNSSGRNNISQNTIYKNRYGIYLSYSFDNNITSNTLSENTYDNIYSYNSNYNRFSDNQMRGGGIFIDGESVEHWNTHTIDTKNTINSLPLRYLKDQIGGTVSPNAGQIILANCNNVLVQDQELNNGSIGILVGFSSNNNISNNNASYNRIGISLYFSSRNNITNNRVTTNNMHGLSLSYSTNNNIMANTATSNTEHGIHLYESASNHINGNNASYNHLGINLNDSPGNNLTSNTMHENGLFIDSEFIEFWDSQEIDTFNTVNGKPMYYLKNQTGAVIPSNAGQVILVNSTNVEIENVDIVSSSVGFEIGFCSYIRIANNSVSDNWYGFFIYLSNNISFINNTISNNDEGIYLYSSDDNDIKDNYFFINKNGINLDLSNRNEIINNLAEYNSYGIKLNSSDQIDIINNTILDSWYTLWVSYSNDNNIIDNNASDSRDDGLYFYHSHGNNLINNSIISNNGNGLHLDYSNKNNISLNTISINGDYGIYLYSSNSNNINENDASHNRYGIILRHSNNNNITSNYANNNYKGIYLYNSSENDVTYNTVMRNKDGLQVEYSSNSNIITNNAFDSNDDYGIEIFLSNGNVIVMNNASNNKWGGIVLQSSNNSYVSDNIAVNGGLSIFDSYENELIRNNVSYSGRGINIWDSNDNNLIDNNASFCKTKGIYMQNSHNNTISKSNISSNNESGIWLESSNDNQIIDNIVSLNNDDGIYLYLSTRNNITNNSVNSNNNCGIYLENSYYNTITENKASFNALNGIWLWFDNQHNDILKNNVSLNMNSGINLYYSNNNQINDNIVLNNIYGIYLNYSNGITLSGNRMFENGILIKGFFQENWDTHNIDETNIVNGEPVYFRKNQTSGVVPEKIGQVILVNCTNFRVENQTLNNATVGIEIGFSSNNYIINNNISNNQYGFYSMQSSTNEIENNKMYYCTLGINFLRSHRNNLTSNEVSYNKDGMYFDHTSWNNIIDNNITMTDNKGLYLDSYNLGNSIRGNNISYNNYGIFIDSHSYGNSIIGENIISYNSEFGVYNVFEPNYIYHNNIIANDVFDSYDNQWDNDYPSGGNYWSDYSGIDIYNGPDQDQPGSDGIGDTPYIIDSNSRDNYPFMEPFLNDKTPPQIISGPDVVLIGDIWAVIGWETDESSDSTVEYGLTTNYGYDVLNLTHITSHSVNLTGLNPSTQYHFRVISKDIGGNEVVSGDDTFTTDSRAEPVHNLDKNTYYDTIQEAIDDADSGNSIFVSKGTYYENLIVDKPMNLIGEDRDNTIINGSNGNEVVLISADDISISHFTITSGSLNITSAGILLNNVQNSNINNNNITINFAGIAMNSSTDIIISQNHFSENGYGIYVESSTGIDMTGNIIQEGGIFINGPLIEHWTTHDIDTTNTLNGKPVYYWKNRSSGTIPADAGQIILANCNNVIIENQDISDTTVGIELGFAGNNEIRENTISSNIIGIFLISSSNENSITDNILTDNGFNIILGNSNRNNIQGNYLSEGGFGIMATDSDESKIKANNIFNNTYGISLWSSQGNNISENNLSQNEFGIYVWTSNWNNITRNMISNNANGIYLGGFIDGQPLNNLIYHNSFIDNTNQSIDTSDNKNQWDNGYPSGGNYWSDYTGSDSKNGPNQDISGSDGIGDSAYQIDSDSRDNFPLIVPWGEDVIPPTIELVSPLDNSIIKQGTIIKLNISDPELGEVFYSINGGADQFFLSSYTIDTIDWEDGSYLIEIQATDSSDNIKTASFNFIVDSTPPSISLESPNEGSYIGLSPEISLMISDENLGEVLYSINSGNQLPLYDPFTIDGSGWPEGEITLTIYAYDLAGNSNEKSFVFIKDNIYPIITLISPFNESILMEFSTINFEITDDNLDSVSYSLNQGSHQTFEDPYDLDTNDWDDGEYIIAIKAEDAGGNINEMWYNFRKDIISPSIESTSISDSEVNVEADSQIVIQFSEPMDTESVESAISISPYIEYSLSWSDDNKTLTITCDDTMEYETLYQVSISTKAKDLANRGLDNKLEFVFTTQAKPKGTDGGDFPVLYLLLAILVAVIIVVLILVMVMSKKKKIPVSGVDPELLSGVAQTPQTMQFTCSNCNNLLQVNDTGATQNVTCPYCSTYLTVPSQITTQVNQSQYPTQPQIQQQPQLQPQIYPQVQTQTQVQQPTQSITCPKCQYRFSVVKPQGPIQIQCPNCGVQGTLR